MKIKCIAIDDEPLALRQICSYIERLDFLELHSSWSDPRRAVEQIESMSETIILFVDIDMPYITGIEIAEQVEGRHYVVFTTAYNNYAIDGFRVNAIDYILKPIAFADFQRAAQKVLNLHRLKSLSEQSDMALSAPEDDMGYISIKADYKVTPVKISDIVFIESVGEYVRLNLRDGSTLTTLYRLKNMESELPSTLFVRIHRSYVVNMSYIHSFSRNKIELLDNNELPIGESYRDPLTAQLDEFYSSH